MWRWRDGIIDAFNRNQPFDRFTVEQLAGDLLPRPTLEQRIATGFNRNHRGNGEGGVIPEEYAVEYVADRVETTATVWLGVTLGCARCHDHKFDPLSQRDFYRFFAYFNNVPERGKAVKFGNSPPYILSPTPAQQEGLAELDRQLSMAIAEVKRLEPELASVQSAWEATLVSRPLNHEPPIDELHAHFPMEGDSQNRVDLHKGAIIASGIPAFTGGRLGHAAEFDGSRFLEAQGVGEFGFLDKFTVAAWVFPTVDRGTIVSRMVDAAQAEGYSVGLTQGRLQINLVKRWLDDALRVETANALPVARWSHVALTYDGSRVASGMKVYVDGKPAKIRVLLDDLNQSFKTAEPFRIGAGNGPDGRFQGLLDEVRVYSAALLPEEVAQLAVLESVNAIASLPPSKRSGPQAAKLRGVYLTGDAPLPLRNAHHRLRQLHKARASLVESFPTTMVMEEMAKPRPAFVLVRGQYDRPGERVSPGVPTCLPPSIHVGPKNRLGLAEWLVQPDHPLTARVAVNRLWQMIFGTGLVKTVDDFGAQGEPPSHPELLDWLATEYVRLGWDTKALLRTIVTSATYRQSSRVTADLLHRDPDNRLLARGPRLRLSAEMVRDQALAAGGLLVERLGGPAVRPYQPPGLWKELTGADDYVPDRGEGLYRRSLYTFWKRTVAPPAMMTFDAGGRETCVVRESRTNTPLQALNLLNDVTYVEAARKLGERVLREAGPSAEDRIAHGFLIVTSRRPRPEELSILLDGWHEHRRHFTARSEAARKLARTGASRTEETLDTVEVAAYTTVLGLLFNLDEVVTKE
jgi:hypothetical protein